MYKAAGLTGLSVVQTSKNLALAFQLSNGDEVKKTCMVVRTTWDHVGKTWCLANSLLKKTLSISVFILFGAERKTRNRKLETSASSLDE